MNAKQNGLVLAVAIATLPGAALAGPAQQLQIGANVAKSCDFKPIPPAALGSYNWHVGIDTTVAGGLSVQCNAGVVYWFTSDRGVNSVGSQNFLASGDWKLAYSLLVQDGGARPFDPAGNGGAAPVTEIATGNVDRYALVLSVPASQMVPAGAYVDTVSFSLNY